MTIRQGRCTNFGNCVAADSKETIHIPEGADFICTVCGHQLTEKKQIASSSVPIGIILGVVFVLLLVAVISLFHSSAHSGSSTKMLVIKTSGNSASLRLCGSNTIGSELAPALVQAFLKDQGVADAQISSGQDKGTKVVAGTLSGSNAHVAVLVQAHGSATAFTGLADGSCDIGMASRQINPEEIAKLASLGDMTSFASEHVLGLDGIAVIVNPSNPLTSLNKDQLAKVFSGEARDWLSVGGGNGAIQLYARDNNSGTFDTFKGLVLQNGGLASSARRFEDSTALSDNVASDPNGIGFIGLPYVKSAKAIAVAERGAMALLPNRFTVATEDYPLSRRLYLYTPSNPQNPYTRKFIQFAVSKAGQDIVAANGFIAQNIEGQRETVVSFAPAEYRRLTSGAQRLSLDFRFHAGRISLDNKAIADLDRVISFAGDQHYYGDNILLFGFSDNTGTRQSNQKLSEERARSVDEQFEQRGLHPSSVIGFGPDLPVASNDTDEGREKNRRVEIWVKK